MHSLTRTICSGLAAFAASLGMQAMAWAGEQRANEAMPSSATTVAMAAEADVAAVSPQASQTSFGHALDRTALEELRGGETQVETEVRNDGQVDGNSATDIISGYNIIGEDAFSNASGISTVIQNSGSNVLIQNGTAVNVQFVAPPR